MKVAVAIVNQTAQIEQISAFLIALDAEWKRHPELACYHNPKHTRLLKQALRIYRQIGREYFLTEVQEIAEDWCYLYSI